MSYHSIFIKEIDAISGASAISRFPYKATLA